MSEQIEIYEVIMKILWGLNEGTLGVQWDKYESAIRVLWGYNEGANRLK